MDELTKLKAEAYDCAVQIENWQRKLQEINQKIATFKGPVQTPPAPTK